MVMTIHCEDANGITPVVETDQQIMMQVADTPVKAIVQLLSHCTLEEINKLRTDTIGKVLRKRTEQ